MTTTAEDVLNIVSGKKASTPGIPVKETDEKVKQEDASKEAVKEDASKEDVSKEDVSKEDVSKEDVSKEDVSKEDISKEDAEGKDVSEDKEIKEPKESKESKDPTEKAEPAAEESSVKDKWDIPITESPEFKKLQGEYERMKAEKDELESLLPDADPLKYFANENEYKKQQVLKENPDINPGALDILFSKDVKDMSPVDILVHDYMLRTGETDQTEIREYVQEKYNYDSEGKVPFGLKADANEARKRLMKIVNQEVAAPKDLKSLIDTKKAEAQERLNKIDNDFKPIVDKMVSELSGVERSDGEDVYLKYDYDPATKEKLSDIMMGYLRQSGVTLDNAESHLKEARAVVEDAFIIANLKKIIKAHVDDAVAAKDDEWRKKIHNPKETNKQTAPPEGTKTLTPEGAMKVVGG